MDITVIAILVIVAMFGTVAKSLKVGGGHEGEDGWEDNPLPPVCDSLEEKEALPASSETLSRNEGMEGVQSVLASLSHGNKEEKTKRMEATPHKRTSPIARELRSPSGARRAFVLSEIFNRKY